MSDGLHLLPRHREKIEELLRAHLPDVEVWAYGSRVTGESHDGSDLDLVLRGPELKEIDLGRLGDFAEAVEMSTIPFIVEARDWASIPKSFHESILQSHLVLVEAGSHSPSRSSPARAGDRHETVAQPLADAISRTGSRLRIGEWAPFSYGKGLPEQTRAATGNIRVYGSSGVVGHHDTALTNGPTVIIGRKGTVGAVHYSPDPCWPIDTTFFVEGDDHALHRFKYYALKAADLQNMNADSAVPGLNRNEAHAELIYVPPVTEQRSIGRILGALDDKIELNRRMSETLDEMARALFRSWFVDFDPVHAKAQGRPTGLPDDLDALFPDSFEPSELGDIPTGWHVKELGDIAEFAYGKALKAQDRQAGDVPVYGSNGQIGWHHESLVTGPGIIVGRKGNPGLVRWSHTDFYPIDTTFYVISKETQPSLQFLFFVLETQDLPSITADTAVPGLNRNLAYLNKQVVPSRRLMDLFDKCVTPTFTCVQNLAGESRTLASLRDMLLPKLLSGELRVRTGCRGVGSD